EQGIEKTTFTGYVEFGQQSGEIIGLLHENAPIEKLEGGCTGAMIVDVTPFYGESGGQVGDRGKARTDNGHAVVSDTQRLPGGLVLHSVKVESGELSIGDKVKLAIDTEWRVNTARNHTATHLLHAALRDRLGEHVRQSGSMVAPDHLRFDFSHFAPVDAGQLTELERDVNEVIRADITMEVREMTHREAIDQGALAFFGDKYGDVVRVVNVPGISTELCGGTHVARTGEIGTFMIIKEESVAAGTRRIEAITGAAAVECLQQQRSRLRQVTASLKTSEEDALDSVDRVLLRLKEVERGNEELRMRLASREASTDLEDYEVEVKGIKLLRREVEDLDAGGLRRLADSMKKEIGSGIVVLGTRNDDGAQIVVGVTADLSKRIKAGDIVSSLAKLVGGGGGGKAEMAQAGGPDGSNLSRMFETSTSIIEELLG
ncbi:MAG: DHHA1 domain-containing protein, partial [Acidobacteriota bacterium]|nr:DHHA1 domain-containing protein [Acidobacteriota bacterium]